MTSNVRVYVELEGSAVLAGQLYSHRRRQVESASFAYAESYLTHVEAYPLDPVLELHSGTQQTPVGLPLFRAFTDSSPDRWGRNLILRAEAIRARQGHRAARSFGEFDLLLGVRDDLRQGALRFRTADDATFLAAEGTGVPHLTELPTLLSAADRVDANEADAADLALLLRAGSSLGGARPKAHVLDVEGALAIAKFPSPGSDRWNVMAWEKTALDLAALAGIDVPPSRLVKVSDRDVLIVDRFDRDGARRVGYCSALTLLEASDGEVRSYLEIAEALEARSAAADHDLRQLWRRIAFSVLISNTDDHLRNHGFVHDRGDSWSLSPAFDLNPNPDPGPKYLSTAIDLDDTTASIELVLDVAHYFRLTPDRARTALAEVLSAHAGWEAIAARNGLTRAAIDDMAPAFEHLQTERARELVRA